jgi:uncharacterized protein
MAAAEDNLPESASECRHEEWAHYVREALTEGGMSIEEVYADARNNNRKEFVTWMRSEEFSREFGPLDFKPEQLFIDACCWGPMEEVAVSLSAHPELANARAGIDTDLFCGQSTPLHCACLFNRRDLMALLLSSSPPGDPTAVDGSGSTPLHYAPDGEWAKTLISSGADVECPSSDESPLLSACVDGRTDVVRVLLDHGADISRRSSNGCSCLHLIPLPAKHMELLNVLLDAGADVNARNDRGGTALHHAVRCGASDAVSVLVDRGAVIDAVDNHGQIPLCIAFRMNHLSTGKRLAECGADVTLCFEGVAPLMLACMYARCDVECAELMLSRGASVGCGSDGKGPIHFAPSVDVARVLVAHGADVKSVAKYGLTPLHCAAGRGDASLVRYLLDEGADVNASYESGETPLHCAAARGDTAVVRLLLARGADASIRTSGGSNVLEFSQGESVQRWLLEHTRLPCTMERLEPPLREEVERVGGVERWRDLMLRFRLLAWRRSFVVAGLS